MMANRFGWVFGGVVLWAGAAAAQGVPVAPAAAYAGPTTGVVRLPWGEFRRLVDELRRLQDPQSEPLPPVDAAVTSAVYRIVVDDAQERAEVDASVDLVVLRAGGWVDVPLLPDAAAIESFAVDRGSATVMQRDGHHRLVARAEYAAYGALDLRRLTLLYRVRVSAEGGPRAMDLPLVASPSSRIEIDLPRPDQEVRLEPDGVIVQRVTEGGRTRVTALVPRGDTVRVRWSDRAAPIREEPLRAVADVVHRLAFQRHVAAGELQLSVDVQRGSFDALAVRFPAQAEGIRAGGDYSVEVEPEEGGTQLAWVRCGYARREATEIRLRYEMAGVGGEIVPPDLKVAALLQEGERRDLVRQSGFLVLHADEGMEVTARGDPEGAEPCDVSEVPVDTALPGQAVLAYRTSSLPVRVLLAVTRHEERAVLASAVQRAELDLVVNAEGRGVGDLRLWVENNERQFLGVELPAGATLWATFVRGRPVKPSGSGEWVLVPVPRSEIDATGTSVPFEVEVLYYQPVPRIRGWWGRLAVEAPRVDLLVSRYDVTLWVPPDHRYFDFGGDARPEQEEAGPGSAGGAVITPASDDDVFHRQAFDPTTAEPRGRDQENRRWEEEAKAAAEMDEEMSTGDEGGMGVRMGRREFDDVEPDVEPVEPSVDVGRMSSTEVQKGEAASIDRLRVVPSTSRGLLPIRVDVPRTGLALRFTRSLVEPKGGTAVGFRFQSEPVTRSFPWLRRLAGLLVGFGLFHGAWRSWRRRRFAPGVAAPIALVLGLALLVTLATFLGTTFAGGVPALIGWTALVYVLIVGVPVFYRWAAARSAWIPRQPVAAPVPVGPSVVSPAPPPPPEPIGEPPAEPPAGAGDPHGDSGGEVKS